MRAVGFEKRELHLSALLRSAALTVIAIPAALLLVLTTYGSGAEYLAFQTLLAQACGMFAIALIMGSLSPVVLRTESLMSQIKE